MKLADLPAELLDYIARHLDHSGLSQFSLVDRTCRLSGISALLEVVSIEPSQASRLRREMQVNENLKHIRILEIRSELPSTLHYNLDGSIGQGGMAQFDAKTFDNALCHVAHQTTEITSWQGVAELLEHLPNITDLIWACKQQLPSRILRSLHEYPTLVKCRLHLRAFRLHSLSRRHEVVDPHELALVQSPNLHSIWFNYDIADTWNNEYEMPEVVSRTVQGLASNLFHVRLWENTIGAEPDQSDYAHQISTLDSATSDLSHQPGTLKSLVYAGGPSQSLTASNVEQWARCTDLRVLEKLLLYCRVEAPVLVALTQNCFHNLTAVSLQLEIEPYYADRYRSPPDESSSPAQDFLCSIPRLKWLKLTGEMAHQRLRHVISYHGMSLRTLCINSQGYSPSRLCLPPCEVSWIAERCFALEELSLDMLRCKGDRSEVAAYSAIGRIRTLQTLALTLHASDYLAMRDAGEVAEAKLDFDDFDKETADIEEYFQDTELRKGHIKDTFINAALDEELARSILYKILGSRPNRALPFDSVELQCVGCGDFGIGRIAEGVYPISNEIQRRWLFKRYLNMVSSLDAYEIKELKHPQRLLTWEQSTALARANDGEGDGHTATVQDVMKAMNTLSTNIERIFRHLWPAKDDGSDWRLDWHSFELSE